MSVDKAKGQSRAAVAADVTAGFMDFHFDHVDGPFTALVQVRTAAGVLVAWDGAVVVSPLIGKRVRVDNTGAVDFAATDVVNVLVAGA